MPLEVYLDFNGNCREALAFYGKVFGAEPTQIMTFGEMPVDPNMPIPEEAKDRILNASIIMAGSRVLMSDTMPNSPVVIGRNITIMVVSDDEDMIRRAFEGLKEDGEELMELQETFWSPLYGYLVDKFGVGWQLNFEPKDASEYVI